MCRLGIVTTSEILPSVPPITTETYGEKQSDLYLVADFDTRILYVRMEHLTQRNGFFEAKVQINRC